MFFKRFLVAAALTITVIVAVYAIAFNYQFGAPIPSSYDLAGWMVVKQDAASRANGKRVLVFGDSNVLFGIDSEVMEKKLQMQVVNFGLHGALPLDWHLDVVLHEARQGDVVVFPFVLDYYVKDYRDPEVFMVNQVVAWDRAYFDKIGIMEKLRYVKAVSPVDLYRNVNTKFNAAEILKANPTRVIHPYAEMLNSYRIVENKQTVFSYEYTNINPHGDMMNTCGKRAAIYGSEYSLFKHPKISQVSLELMKRTVKKLESRGVKVFIAAPVQVDDDATRSEKFQNLISNIWEELGKSGLPIIGQPTDFFYPASSFFDTNYHLNCSARGDRSARLAELLKASLTVDPVTMH